MKQTGATIAAFALLAAAAPGRGQATPLVRAFDDPACGVRWLLVRDAAHPGGPGRLVPTALSKGSAEAKGSMEENSPVIRAGDGILLEEHTAVADVRLEAVALGPARAGERFAVRLKMGGRPVAAEALSPGRAIFAPEMRDWQ